jgi:hypothetical protein
VGFHPQDGVERCSHIVEDVLLRRGKADRLGEVHAGKSEKLRGRCSAKSINSLGLKALPLTKVASYCGVPSSGSIGRKAGRAGSSRIGSAG